MPVPSSGMMMISDHLQLPESWPSIGQQIRREYIVVMTRPERFSVREDGPAVWVHFARLSRNFDFTGQQLHGREHHRGHKGV
jgi:hypothetical protein